MVSQKRVGLYAAGVGALAVCSMLFTANKHVEARPQYMKKFNDLYSGKYGDQPQNCGVCHVGQNKKQRNDYGAAVGKELGSANVQDDDKLKEALEKAGKADSATKNKTFGDLIEAGKLPGKAKTSSSEKSGGEKSGKSKGGGYKKKR